MRKAREARGIGVGEMAGIMMRNRNTINNYESDKTRPPRLVLDRWAEVTGIPLEWIIGDADPFGWRTPPPPRGVLLTSNRHDDTVTDRYPTAAVAA